MRLDTGPVSPPAKRSPRCVRSHCAANEHVHKNDHVPYRAARYWATPHTPCPLDGPNGRDEVFPGAHCDRDGRRLPRVVTDHPLNFGLPCRRATREGPVIVPCRPGAVLLPSNAGNAMAVAGRSQFIASRDYVGHVDFDLGSGHLISDAWPPEDRRTGFRRLFAPLLQQSLAGVGRQSPLGWSINCVSGPLV